MGLSERIKSLRKSKNWTQIELAEKLNVTDKAVSKWENNEANPDILLLPDISKLFNVSIDFLLTGEEKIEISLDDMDDSKRIQYLIEKDDDKYIAKIQ